MSPVSSIGQLVAVIQSQLAPQVRPRMRTPVSRKPAAGADRDVQAVIELRVGQIAADDPQRGRKAFRIFLEAVLLQELGSNLQSDPAFHQVVDDVQRVLEGDARCGPLIRDAISHLLGGALPGAQQGQR